MVTLAAHLIDVAVPEPLLLIWQPLIQPSADDVLDT
jgi:hypothetical protein